MIARAILLALVSGSLGAAMLAGGAADPVRAPLAAFSAAEWQPRPGDVILTAADDLIGTQIRAASGREGVYSHIGLVVTGADGPAVVEATPFGTGKVAMKPVGQFTADPGLVEILVLRPRGPIDQGRLSAEAARLTRAGVPFDYDFDLADGSALYCAELVFNLLRDSGADLTGIAPIPMWVPLRGEQPVLPPHAFARAPQFDEIARRVR